MANNKLIVNVKQGEALSIDMVIKMKKVVKHWENYLRHIYPTKSL